MKVPNPLEAIGALRELSGRLERIARGTDALRGRFTDRLPKRAGRAADVAP